jgi:hypothetical protein
MPEDGVNSGTPVLRADALEDDLQHEDIPAADWHDGEVHGHFAQVCPVCGLEECHHNLQKVEKFIDEEAGR